VWSPQAPTSTSTSTSRRHIGKQQWLVVLYRDNGVTPPKNHPFGGVSSACCHLASARLCSHACGKNKGRRWGRRGSLWYRKRVHPLLASARMRMQDKGGRGGRGEAGFPCDDKKRVAYPWKGSSRDNVPEWEHRRGWGRVHIRGALSREKGGLESRPSSVNRINITHDHHSHQHRIAHDHRSPNPTCLLPPHPRQARTPHRRL
jgi:hypothetical protein